MSIYDLKGLRESDKELRRNDKIYTAFIAGTEAAGIRSQTRIEETRAQTNALLDAVDRLNKRSGKDGPLSP
jgi:ubiquinone biosynthesis protein UbiJ